MLRFLKTLGFLVLNAYFCRLLFFQDQRYNLIKLYLQMKNFTGKATFLSLLILGIYMFGISHANAQSIQLNDQETQLSISENTYTLLSLENTVSKLRAFKVKATEGDFSQIKINGYGYSMDIGKPQLPVIKKLIEIPLGASIEISITQQSYKDYDLADFGINDPIIPTQASVSKSCDDPSLLPFEYDHITYATDALMGNKLVDVIEIGMMRGVMIARVEIAPVHYNPAKNQIRVFDELDVVIKFNDANIAATIEAKETHTNRYFKSVHQMLLNYKPVTTRELQDAPVSYIIVSDPMFEDALQPFIEWKTKKGFKVVEAYTNNPEVGTTTSSIKSYLKDFYENPPAGYNPQSFVLFVGDIDQIPAFSGNAGGHVTDLYYCEYTNDLFPEAYYGRFSAENLNHLQPQIDKTLEYEQYLMPDPSFLDEVVMAAGADGSHQLTWGNGQINYGTENYFNEAHGLTSHTYLQPEPGGGNYSQNIRQNISDGVSYANYTAHCSPSGWADPSFVISHIPALTNAHMYCLMVGNCCSSVEFQTDCFGEEILRAPLKGALGYIGGSNSTYWDEDFWWGVGYESISANPPYNAENLGAYDRTFHDKEGISIEDFYITQGQMPAAGNFAVTQAGASLEEYYWEIYHLMGDPSLSIYLSQPPDINASYAGLMPLGSLTFTVNCDPYAYVAISKDGVLHGTALADESGVAEVVFETPISVPGEADVVITGQNLKPYFGTVTVASPDGAYILLDDYAVNDDAGNSNGLADYGEDFSLDVSLKNLGSDAGENVTLNLASTDMYVTINNATANLGNIAPDEIIDLTDVFGITLAEDVPDQYSIAFTIDASDGTDTWNSNFSIKGHAPVLEFSDFMVYDANGNNNGKLDPGETVDIMIYVVNTGSAEAYSALCDLTTNDMYLTVLTSEPQEIGDIEPMGDGTATFQVSASSATPAGHLASLDVDISADMGIAAEGEFSVVVGQIPVLIVDLDENNNSANLIMDAIDDLDISAEIQSSFPADLNLYSSIFVCLGVYSDNYQLSSAEGNALAAYLNNGGMLYMEGGDTWYYDDQTAVHTMFGIDGVSDGSGDLGTVNGVAGTMTEGLSYNYSGDNNWIDHLAVSGTGELIFNNASPAYGCGVSNDPGNYKTVGTSFEFGGISDADSRNELMNIYLEFFEILGGNAMNCNMTANPGVICQGETSQFNVQIVGGSGNYEYAWTPETGLSNPSIANPVADPTETTMYTVTITDMVSNEQVVDQMELTVNPTPATPTIVQTGDNLVSSSATGNQWYDINGMIGGATGQIYAPGQTGNYWSIVSNTVGCESEPSNTIYFQPTNIEELNNGGKVNIYPNPAGNTVTIDYITLDNQEVTISLFNAFGQVIHNITQSNVNRTNTYSVQFDVSQVVAGVYYFKIEGQDFSYTKKIIISK
jgi:hypothetical protein